MPHLGRRSTCVERWRRRLCCRGGWLSICPVSFRFGSGPCGSFDAVQAGLGVIAPDLPRSTPPG
eukprot:1898988-Pyramimonas_sp.AAC.1